MIQSGIDLVVRFYAEGPIKTWAILTIIGIVIESVVTPGRYVTSNTWLNIRYGIVYALAIFFISPSVSICVNYILQKIGAGFINLDFFSPTSIVQQVNLAVLILIVTDFFYYWLHRAQHSFGWLWHQHAVHHSDEALNITTSARHHWLEFIFQAIAISIPMSIIFKMSPISMWAVSSFVGAYGWFNHMNVKLGFGKLSWLACSPQLHRIHHSSQPEHIDKNFAAYFPVWDVLFGTYYHPAKDEYPRTGVDGIKITSATEAALYPFKKWATAMLGHKFRIGTAVDNGRGKSIE